MACCGGAKRSHVKSQPITVQRTQSILKHPKIHKTITNNKYTIPRVKCPTCGYPVMVVNIGGRERQQCSNVDCRIILKWSIS